MFVCASLLPGSPFRPGHLEFQHIRGALEFLEAAAMDDPGTGQPRDAEASMLLRRLKIYSFNVRLDTAGGDAQVPYCARCFAQLLLTQGSE